MTYADLADDIVAAQRNVLGEEAVAIARGVEALTVRDDGSVDAIQGDGRRAVEELVSAYVDDLGAAAKVTLRSVAEDHADRLELPRSLQ